MEQTEKVDDNRDRPLTPQGTPDEDAVPHRKLSELAHRTAPALFVVITGVLLFVGLDHFSAVCGLLRHITDVCSPFIAGLVLAILLDGPTRWLEQHGWKRMAAAWFVFICVVLALVLVVAMLLPNIWDSIVQLVSLMPVYLTRLMTLVDELSGRYGLEAARIDELLGSYASIMSHAMSYLQNELPSILKYTISIGNAVLKGIEAVMATMYILLAKKDLMRQMRKLSFALFPQRAAKRIVRISGRTAHSFTGFINGKVLDSILIALLSFVVLTLLKMPYVVLLSAVIGVTNIIPFFGPFIGAVPNTMIVFLVNPWLGLEYIIFTLVLQQFDGNILGPRILGDSIGLPPLWVLFSIVVSGGLFGFVGMLLGVPLFAVIYSLVQEWTHERLEDKELDEYGQKMPHKT